jgi:hypothetical protein
LLPDKATAEDLICFTQADANKLFIELEEHHKMCPLIEHELTQVTDRLNLSEQEVVLKEKQITLLKEEVELSKQHIENMGKLSDLQKKECIETIDKLKPTFWETFKDTAIKVGIGILVGVVIAL